MIFATIVVVTNIGFTAAFDTNVNCPRWVNYDLEPDEVIHAERAAVKFSADPRIADTDLTDDYKCSGYDRGHMAPAADFNWSTNALRETYYYSNISPQLPFLNRGSWLDVEREIRNLAASGTVHVLIFPCYFTNKKIGRVTIPGAFCKIAWGWFGVKQWCFQNDGPNGPSFMSGGIQ